MRLRMLKLLQGMVSRWFMNLSTVKHHMAVTAGSASKILWADMFSSNHPKGNTWTLVDPGKVIHQTLLIFTNRNLTPSLHFGQSMGGPKQLTKDATSQQPLDVVLLHVGSKQIGPLCTYDQQQKVQSVRCVQGYMDISIVD